MSPTEALSGTGNDAGQRKSKENLNRTGEQEDMTQTVVGATQPTLFDYGTLDEPTRVFVQEKAQAIHARLKRTAEDVIAIGQSLIEVKERLGHGQFSSWVQSEFELSLRSAEDFMQLADRFGNTKVAKIAPTSSVLRELLNSDETVIEMVESGAIPATLPAIREAKRELQEDPTSVIPADHVIEELAPSKLPPGWGARDGSAFDMPLPDGKPVEIPQEWKLPPSMNEGSAIIATPVEIDRGYHHDAPFEEAKAKRDAHVLRVMGSSESPEWYTPQEIVRLSIELLGEIDLDPCSNSHENPNVPAHTIYTKEDDGLAQKWRRRVYLNPPYGAEIGKWVEKLTHEYEHGEVEEAIALLPARIDTMWFQPLYEYPMCNVRGRLQFENAVNSAPFPSVIVYLGKREDAFIHVFGERGPIMRRIG